MSQDALENLSVEERRFAPSELFVGQANVSGALYEQAGADRLGFWAEQGEDFLSQLLEVTRS